MSSLIRTKSLSAIQASLEEGEAGKGLRRTLTTFDLVMLGIGAVIGAGIFSTIGTAAVGEPGVRAGAGPALVISFVLLGVVCALAGLCYAELTAMIPISGSAYTYSYATLGELVAWIIGWDLMLEYAVGNVAVAIAWSDYFHSLLRVFGVEMPFWLTTSYRNVALSYPERMGELPVLWGHHVAINVPGTFIVLAITWVLAIGIRESSRVNNAMVVLKLAILALFVGVGFFYLEPANWHPFAPNGWRGIHQGAAIVFFAYIGFDAISTAAEETKDPQKTMPTGIMTSLAICTLIYVVIGLVATGIVPFTELKGSDPLARAFEVRGVAWMHLILALGAVVSMTAVLLVFPHLLFDEPRRPAAAHLPEDPPALRHAVRGDHRDGDPGRARLLDLRRRRDLRPHEHRDAVRLLRRVCGRARAPRQGPGPAAPVPRPRRVAGRAAGRRGLRVRDDRAARPGLDPLRGVDDPGARGLLRLRVLEQPPARAAAGLIG
jgi:APA family basic amino acid/polyamine antiporter